MGRLAPQSAKIVWSLANAFSKQVMPDSIHDDAASQGVVLTEDIVRQLKSTALCDRVRRFIERFEKSSRYGFRRLLVVSTYEEGLCSPPGFIESRNASWDGDLILKLAIPLDQRRRLREFTQGVLKQTHANTFVQKVRL